MRKFFFDFDLRKANLYYFKILQYPIAFSQGCLAIHVLHSSMIVSITKGLDNKSCLWVKATFV